MQKNLGFTLTELLAAVVVLGILMGMAVPAVTSVLRDQRNEMYIEDSIRLASKMQGKMKSDNKVTIPAIGSCVVMSLEYLDDGTFENSPYSKTYDKTRSFVIAKRVVGYYKYNYYVRLVEEISSNNFRGVNLISVDDDASGTYLYMKNAKDKVNNFAANLVYPLDTNDDSAPNETRASDLQEFNSTLSGNECNNVTILG